MKKTKKIKPVRMWSVKVTGGNLLAALSYSGPFLASKKVDLSGWNRPGYKVVRVEIREV